MPRFHFVFPFESDWPVPTPGFGGTRQKAKTMLTYDRSREFECMVTRLTNFSFTFCFWVQVKRSRPVKVLLMGLPFTAGTVVAFSRLLSIKSLPRNAEEGSLRVDCELGKREQRPQTYLLRIELKAVYRHYKAHFTTLQYGHFSFALPLSQVNRRSFFYWPDTTARLSY